MATHSKLPLEHQNTNPRRRILRQKLKHQRTRDLIGRITDTDVKVRQLRHLNHVSKQHFQSLLLWCAHDTFTQFGSHARIEFNCYAFLCFLQYADCEVAGAGADFEDDVGLVEARLLDDGVCYTGVFEDVLAILFMVSPSKVYNKKHVKVTPSPCSS